MADGYRYAGGLGSGDFTSGNTGTGWQHSAFAYGSPITVDVAGTITELGVYCSYLTAPNTVKVALYDSAGDLVDSSSFTTTASSPIQWMGATGLSIVVPAATYYLFLSCSNDNLQVGYSNTASGCGETIAYADFPPASLSVATDESNIFGVRLFLEEQVSESLRPDGTDSAGNWTASTTTIHGDTADESDATYATSGTAPSNDEAVITLGNPSGTPGAGTITLNYRAQKVIGTKQIDLTMGVYEGASLVEAFTETDLSTTLTTYTHDLTSPSISDYTALKVRPKANQSGTPPPTNPSFRAVGVHASGTTSVAFTTSAGSVPTNQEGDLVFIALESSDSGSTAGTPADITDWTKVLADTTSGDGTAQCTTLTVYGRFAPSGGVGNTTVTGIGDHGSGRMIAIQDHGCTSLSDLVVGTVGDHGTGLTGLSTPSITVTANSLILWISGMSDDGNDTTNASAYANTNLADITERADQVVNLGAGGGVALMTATCSGTSTGATTWNHDNAVNSQSLHIGIKPIPTPTDAAARVTRIELLVPESTADTVDDLLANDIAAGTPTLTSAALGQVHGLNANDAASGTPTLTAAALGQVHGLAADDLTGGAPTLTTPALGISHVLLGDDIATGQPTLTAAALGQEHGLLADDLATAAPTLTTATLGQIHALTADDIATPQPTLTTPALTEVSGTDVLLADDIATAAPTLTTATLGQIHALAADDIASGTPELTTPNVTSAAGVDNLLADDLASGAPVLGSPALGQVHALLADDVSAGTPLLDAPVLRLVSATPAVQPSGGFAWAAPTKTRRERQAEARQAKEAEALQALRLEQAEVARKLALAEAARGRLLAERLEGEAAAEMRRIVELRLYSRLLLERIQAALAEEEAIAMMMVMAMAA